MDDSAFWFGTDYPERCPVPENTIECQNFYPTPASMADRLFTKGTFDASTIDTFMEVTIHEKPGRMKSVINISVCVNTRESWMENELPMGF